MQKGTNIEHLQIRIITFILMIVVPFLSLQAQQKKSSEKPIPLLFQKFKYSSEQAILEQHSYFNFTDKSSFSPDIKKFGIKTIFTPPYFINPFTAKFTIFNKAVTVDRYVWYPSESVFKGKTINGVSAKARAIPLVDKQGGIYQVVLKNTSTKTLDVPISWGLQGKPGRVKRWGFYASKTMKTSKNDVFVEGIASGCRFTLAKSEASIVGYGATYQYKDDKALKTVVSIKAGESLKTGIVFVVGKSNGQTVQVAKTVAKNISKNIATTRKHWTRELTKVMDDVPKLEGVSNELQHFYNTGLLSLQSAKWQVPEFIFSPWYGSCGIDGGAMISYLWEMSYAGKFASMAAPETTRKHILSYAKADMGENYAVDPETGKGVGPLYSYNFYNLTRLVYDYVSITGDFSILNEPVGKGTYLDYLYNFSLSKEDLNKPADLIDYGGNHNLLELKKTDAYEHYVPSPNAERVLIYDMLTDLYHYQGKDTPQDLKKRKKQLTKAFREELWNKKLGWLNTLDKKRKRKICYSVQCFSPLRSGSLTKKMEKALVRHLNTKEFLSKWGVYSLSPKDSGYDPNDVDWGGPGIYTGAAPELMADLFKSGFSDKGLDLLNRILWWGELPYLPQAMRTNKEGYRENGRANIISGVCAPQYIAYGLFGLNISINTLKIHPIENDFMKGVSLNGLKIRGKRIAVKVSKDRKTYTVTVDGILKKMPSDKTFLLEF